LKKKKAVSLTTGPPMLPPNWFWMFCGLRAPARLLKKLLASKMRLRWNS
jgi:hypothetical protein